MSERVNHCPFLNRSDTRCSAHFSLDRLGSAFDQCFGTYSTCGVYQEMLAERRDRQGGEAAAPRTEPTHGRPAVYVQVRLPSHPAAVHAA